jgi:bacterioferritin (cytochrome b1)
MPRIVAPSWSRVLRTFNQWCDFEANEYYPQTAYFSLEEARTLTQEAYQKWLKEMEEQHLPDRLARCERFASALEDFRREIGVTDYGDTVVEMVEGIIRATRETREVIRGVLDACSQFRLAVKDENDSESKEYYNMLVDREEHIRKLITVISEGLNRIEGSPSAREDD